MRERYWTFVTEIKYNAYYYKYFQILFNRINWSISVFLSLTTLTCIAAWDIWASHPMIWSSLICFSQIIQAMFPKLPYNDILVSTKFMISSLDKLLWSIESDWLYIEIHQLEDDEILLRLNKHQNQYSELVNQFFSGSYLPTIKWCSNKADKDWETFFSTTYNIK